MLLLFLLLLGYFDCQVFSYVTVNPYAVNAAVNVNTTSGENSTKLEYLLINSSFNVY